jgi:signal transduction histidine kinase
MSSLFWQFVSRTSETEFIFALFHLLLACLTLLVLLSWLRREPEWIKPEAHRLLSLAFSLFVLEFALATFHFGAEFFLGSQWNRSVFMKLSQALEGAAPLFASAGLLASFGLPVSRRVTRWAIAGGAIITALLVIDLLVPTPTVLEGVAFHTLAMVATDVLSYATIGVAAFLLLSSGRAGVMPSTLALLLLLGGGGAHLLHLAWDSQWSAVCWHAEQHLVSFSLVAFAWALGERSVNLFDRVFVRLNLTFILLASLMILSTVSLERFQYIKITEERSLSLAEFLRGYLAFYSDRGEKLETILEHPEVMRRIVVSFGELPDFRRLEIRVGGGQAVYEYEADRSISQRIVLGSLPLPDSGRARTDEDVPARTSFRMIRLPIYPDRGTPDTIELYGGMESLNRYLGSYIIVIYSLFTVMVAASVVVVGIIVSNADHAIHKQHTEIEGIERQLAQAAKLASIGELAGGVAHEINNPVTGILSTATHLAGKRRDTSLTERDREDLRLIETQAERISDTVTKLLTFSRQSRMEISPVDVNEIIEKALSLIQFRLKNTSIVLRREPAPALPRILSDSNRLTEVFVNLMNNAIDAMPEGGVLTLRSEAQDTQHVRVIVSDTGAGIEPSLLERIFDPFFTTKEPGKGTGLGLSISHGIIKGHQGEILVESEPDRGTTFTVVLPTGVSLNAEANPGRG